MEKRAKRAKILYVITKSNWGGAQRYVYDLAIAMSERGFDVSVALGGHGALSKNLRNTSKVTGIKVYEIEGLERDIGFRKEWIAFRSMLRLLKDPKTRPDIVHLNSSKAGAIGALAARLSGIRTVIFTAHGWAFNEERPLFERTIFWLIYLGTVALSTRVIAASGAIARQMPLGMLLGGRVRTIHHGRNAEIGLWPRDVAADHLKTLIRQSIGVNAEGPLLGMVGELHPIKGHRFAIDALEKILLHYPKATLTIVGEGDLKGKLSEYVQKKGLARHVAFIGHQGDVLVWMRAFDALLFPSLSEALGYVAIEAGIAGIPVVASDVGGIPEIITHKESGILVPPQDAEALAQATLSILDDPRMGERLGGRLHETCKAEFTIAKMADATAALYG